MLKQLFEKKVFIQPRSFKKSGAGFTLIEIMVVAAITVLIITVVLVSMGESRNSARDAAIKTSLAEIRKVGEILYGETSSYIGVCDLANDTLSESGDFGRIEDYIEKQGGIIYLNPSV